MKQVDLYLIGKHNIMKAVLDLYNSDVKKVQSLILDCGCGRGTYAYKLSDCSYVGLDIDIASIKLAHKIHPNSMFVIGDATKLPFRNCVFDCVICSEVLEHVLDDMAVLSELARVTKIQGRLIVSVPNIECRNILVNWQRSLIDEEVGHCRVGYSLSDISKILMKSGFTVKKTKYDCGPVTAIVECFVITLGKIFGYRPSSLNQLFEERESLLVKVALGIYRLLFPLLVLFTYVDRLLPRHYRSNIVLLAEKCPH